MEQLDPKKLAYPLTLKDNVFLIGSSWFVFLPDSSTHVERFTMKERAQPLLDKLNEISRRRGGRPKRQEETE